MAEYPIPFAAHDDRLAFIGTSGSGKTYNAGSAVERLLASSAKVVIIDPLGVWWGLRLSANGKDPAFDLPIFGGRHGDLPLSESAGKVIGETVAGMRESCILDLSGLGTKEAERRFMLAFLESLYRHKAGDPMHAIFDEADLWAPQNPSKSGAGPQLQSLMEQIVRRGRVRGFIPWLITQRPAVVSKDVLSQADGLIAFKLTSSQDRAALGAWIEGQADREEGKRILAELPTMPQGRGVIWIPARGILETAQFPLKTTFDSSRTPKRGERSKAHALKSLNLDALREQLGSIEAEAKANDPKKLRAEVTRLQRELAQAERALQSAPSAEALAPMRDRALAAEKRASEAEGKLLQIGKIVGTPSLVIRESIAEAPMSAPAKARPREPDVPFRLIVEPSPASSAEGEVPAGCAKPLAALAGIYPAGMTEAAWATAAGYKRTGGTWGTYKSRLRAAGMIEQREGRFFATEAGANAAGEVELPPAPGPDLVRWWASKLAGTGKVAEALIEAWPRGLSKEDLADRVGMSASGGSFGTYLSRLASPGIITRDGEIRLAEEVMGS